MSGLCREGDPMAARRKSSKARSTTQAQAALVENVQQVWLAGMGAIARAQKDGPAAFQDAVAEGLKLLNRRRAQTEKMMRDAFETAQSTMQMHVEGVRDQAGETWDNLEALFQSRVHKALRQIGVPNGDEIRLLTRRVAELNAAVEKLAGKPVKSGTRRPAAKGRRPVASRKRTAARKLR
jgi:poly(hydroxyalkanoate) granule-associated protein